jgi:large subunit ribosomal protein L29
MEANKLRDLNTLELQQELSELKTELFKLRFQLATNQLDNPMKVKQVKKNIARVKTIMTERQLKGLKD